MDINRRELISGLVALGVAGSACRGRADADPRARAWYGRLPADRQRALAAAVDRVLPGAVAAGAMVYLDYWLTRPPFIFAQREFDTAALLLNRAAEQRFKKSFADASGVEADVVLGLFEKGEIKGKHFDGREFFKRLVTLTIESYLADPKYGGNQGQVGWELARWHHCWYSPRHVDQLAPRVGALPY
ncbi:MAG: gluconate 2-dehydrogenase subunit 3 family protein [Deltaproteobacteria bacterium]|nr:gluconate 2-dehydrogenase subunit 3 family protein [Deltaproteobacteria bacterium]